MKELKISAIVDGTVIDHIPPKAVYDIIRLLGFREYDNVISAATNLQSKKMGKKGIVKIGSRYLTQEEVNKITLVAPNASLCIIKNYKVDLKEKLIVPDEFRKIIKCNNPKCITNSEDIETKFKVLNKNPLKVKCMYCERSMEKDEIELK